MRDPEHLRAFARRDWSAIARAKAAAWNGAGGEASATERLCVASAL